MTKQNNNLVYTLIEPRKKLHLNFGEIWRYRDLIVLFVKKDFAEIYKQTILGPIWLFLNPLISTVIYTVVFGGIANISTDGVPKILFYMAGNTMWTFFSDAITRTSTTFRQNTDLFSKIYFPRLTKPIAVVFFTGINLLFQLLMFAAIWIFYLVRCEVQPHWEMIWTVPFVILALGAMAMGCGIIVSSLTAKYRDLAIVITFVIRLWMYATPVVYPMSTVSNELLRTLININPVTQPMELFRYAVLGQGDLSAVGLVWSGVFAVFVLLFGMMYFNKVEKNFMDTV